MLLRNMYVNGVTFLELLNVPFFGEKSIQKLQKYYFDSYDEFFGGGKIY